MTERHGNHTRLTAAMLAAILVGALVLIFGAGTADADKKTFESTVGLRAKANGPTNLDLSGRVRSHNVRCLVGREITITINGAFFASAGTLANGQFFVVSSTRPPKGTTLLATMEQKFTKRSKRHRHKCTSDFVEARAP